ncbi:MAG: hypothetical protein EXQ94_06025 [Alphaproteobacteria bacterium]|nr:hypothetical protein [Alphaproteobacteria bacterium]
MTSARQVLRLACLALALTVGVPAGRAEADTLRSMGSTGPPRNRVDLIILGDGYTSTEMAKFATDANDLVAYFFSQQPFKTYRKYFNVVRIETPSVVSGTGFETAKNTVYRSFLNCFAIPRLLCADNARVTTILDRNLGSIVATSSSSSSTIRGSAAPAGSSP